MGGTARGHQGQREKESATLPAEKVADLEYVKEAVAAGRPAWWDEIKAGKDTATAFKATVWKHTANMSYTNGPGKIRITGQTVAVSWPREQMDSLDPLPMIEVGLLQNGSFFRGDSVGLSIWSYVAMATFEQTVGQQKFKGLSEAEKAAAGSVRRISVGGDNGILRDTADATTGDGTGARVV